MEGVWKIGVFPQLARFISKTVQDAATVAMEDECGLSSGAIFNNPKRPLTHISRSRHLVVMGVWRPKALLYNSKFATQWHSRDQILKLLKFKMADGRNIGKFWKWYNSPTNLQIWTKLV